MTLEELTLFRRHYSSETRFYLRYKILLKTYFDRVIEEMYNKKCSEPFVYFETAEAY